MLEIALFIFALVRITGADKKAETFAKPLSAAHFCVVRCYALNCIHIRGFAKASGYLKKYKPVLVSFLCF